MMEVQKQWVNVDGKWQHKEVSQPAPAQRPSLPPRSPSTASEASIPPARNSMSLTPSLPTRPAAKSPALPPRRPSETPSSHSRRPSDMMISRRDSNESIQSTATAETSFSALSNGTSFTSDSGRYTIRAPEYDPSSLPKLPPKRTQEEKDAAARAARFPAKSRKSSSNIPRAEAPAVQVPPRPQSRPPPPEPVIGNLPADVETEVPVGPKAIMPPRPNGIPSGGRKVFPFTKADIISQQQQEAPPVLPKRQSIAPQQEAPPTLPKRQPQEAPPALPNRQSQEATELPRRSIVPPPPMAKRSALSMGFGHVQKEAPAMPARPAVANGTPPPVPLSSRPDLAALQASKPKLNGAQPAPVSSASSCLSCRDFSVVDAHAALYMRERITTFCLNWLAKELCDPFPSHTDKARAIFTWLHHNVEYDVVAFFNNNVQRRTPQQTLESGLAVCEGYASLFTTLALKAGVEAVVVGGNGKGFGYSPLKPGEPVPPYNAGHAWNAVKIDGGVWKLVDPCWGAGNVSGKGQPYEKSFKPDQFTKSNDDFGLSHYPEDAARQYRNDGRIMSWEEYMTCNKNGTAAVVFGGFVSEEGVQEVSFKPVPSPIILSQQGPTVRFSFQKVCPHFDPVRHGKGPSYLFVLHTEGLDGTQRNHVPFEKGDGIWWCDVPTADLGRPGQKASIFTVTSFGGKDGRGLTIDEYRRRKGTVGMAFGGVAQWTVG